MLYVFLKSKLFIYLLQSESYGTILDETRDRIYFPNLVKHRQRMLAYTWAIVTNSASFLVAKRCYHFTSPDYVLQIPYSVSGIPRSLKSGTVDDQSILGPRRANDGSQVPTWSLSLGLGSRCTPYNSLPWTPYVMAIPRIHTINFPMFARL